MTPAIRELSRMERAIRDESKNSIEGTDWQCALIVAARMLASRIRELKKQEER